MIYGNGIDIIDINRIREVINKYGFRFKKRCFSISEIGKILKLEITNMVNRLLNFMVKQRNFLKI